MKKKVHGIMIAAVAAVGAVFAETAPFSRFEDGMLSATRPGGWLQKACLTQADGLTGHPEALSYPYDSCLWAGRIKREAEGHGDGWWRYEQTAYYTDGLLRLGYALGRGDFIKKGESGVDYTLDNASPEGYLGDPCLWDAKNHKLANGYEMWPMAVFFRAMKAKYDATHDERIPAALAKYYLLYGTNVVAQGRNTISVEGMLWTYGRTGDGRLLELAERSWLGKVVKKNDWSGDLAPDNCADGDPIYMHGVSYCEELKIPILLYAYTGRKEYLRQAVNVERKLVRDHMLPDGCPSSTEQTRGNSIHWGHETCVISDYTWSLGCFLEVTGDAQYADRIERCVFNAGFGAVTGDFRALQYFSNPNQFIAASDSNHNPFSYGSTWSQYRPTHQTECCAGNVHRFLPNYVSRMWLKDADGAPTAALYGPCEADFGWARIKEETHYPFDGKIVFRFSVKEPRESAFTYRVPGWCAKGASVKVNGEACAAGEPGTFASIRRTFRDGDTVELDFPMETVFEVLPRRHYVIKDAVSKWVGKIEGRSVSQGTVVRRGPLVFAYPIPEERTEDTAIHANMNGKKSANPDFKCWNLRPAGPFNYALAAHEAETVADGDTVRIKVPARRIEWNLVDGRFTPDVPENPVPVSDGEETVTLVPYGETTLRLLVFPDLSGGRAERTQDLRRSGGENRGAGIKVGTYNIRYMAGDKGTPNAWEERKADLVEEMRKLDMDVFGMQEVFPEQAFFITNSLPQYAVVGEYREADRMSGEASPVCYRKDMFEALGSGTFWLSETPDVPGVKGWGAACPRVCSWALLKDRRSGSSLVFANTHADHKSELARKEGMLLVIRRMREFAPEGTPIVFTGDHNCRETEGPALAVGAILTNALYACETAPNGPWRTFNGWAWRDVECSTADALKLPPRVRNARKGSPDADKDGNGGHKWENCGARIDYIYVSKDVKVKSYETHGDPRPGKRLYPSDHFPVSARIELPAPRANGR